PTIGLPSDGGERDYFIDVVAGPVLRAELMAEDDLSADNQAWLVREGSWPAVEARSPLGPALRRMIAAYRGTRPASDASSAHVALVGQVGDLPGALPAVVIGDPPAP